MLGASYGFTLLGFMPMQAAWVWAFGGYALAFAIAFVFSFNVKTKMLVKGKQNQKLQVS
ncbi:MAG: hypothetical protein ACI9WC_000921 [Arenicella sp.]|jgi:hypothetical protein